MFYWLSYTKHMIINKVTMHIMIKLIQMLLIFVFEIRPRDRLQNDSDAMTVFIIISLSPRDYRSELFNVGGFPTDKGLLFRSYSYDVSLHCHKLFSDFVIFPT